MTTPAADKTSEDQRRQNRQGKKMNPALIAPRWSVCMVSDGSIGETVLAHDPPLDDVGDHEQIKEEERGRAPAAGF